MSSISEVLTCQIDETNNQHMHKRLRVLRTQLIHDCYVNTRMSLV